MVTMSSAPLLDLAQWSRPANPTERELLDDVAGPVLDIGCGPGRLVAALRERGVHALGIDAAPAAITRAKSQGVHVLTRSVFDHIPSEGTWATALLLDGNIGIGGDPQRLLTRVHELLASEGVAVVELESPGATTRNGLVQLEIATEMVGWFPWSWVSSDDIHALAYATNFFVNEQHNSGARRFATLRRIP
jgi:SAM-dependent methyltransferase